MASRNQEAAPCLVDHRRSLGGTAVKIHITFVLFLAWIAFSAWANEGVEAALDSTVFIVLLFLCVVLHEFGHILAARRYGIRSPEVTLLPIGGVASMPRLPSDPRQELVVALAGPAVISSSPPRGRRAGLAEALGL